MAATKRLAYTTDTPPSRTRGEIDALLGKAGAESVVIGHDDREMRVAFLLDGHRIMVGRPMPPKPMAPRNPETRTKRGLDYRSKDPWEQYDQEVARRWRVTLRHIQVMLELVAESALDVEDAFMPWLVLPDRSIVRDHIRPAVRAWEETGQMPETMLPGLPPASKVIELPSRTGS